MTQYDVAPPPRRRIGLKAPITGLVLIGLVVFASYWGWQRAFGDSGVAAVASGCPTPTTATPTPTAPPGTAPPATATAIGALHVAAGRSNHAVAVAATTPAVPPPTTPVPTVTTPAFLAPADVLVNVFNATSRAGLAANTAAVLQDRGFSVEEVGNAETEDLVAEAAQIRAGVADSPQVRLLVQHVPGAVVVADGRTGTTIDLVLGDQFTSLGDPALVTPVPLPSSAC